jgi:hypothetical protein
MNKSYLLIITLLFSFGCDQNVQEKESHTKSHSHSLSKVETYYTCSMHPQVKEHSAGKCPICHMNLTKVEVEVDTGDMAPQQAKITWQCQNFPDVTSEKEDVCPIDGTRMVKKVIDAGEVIAKVKLRKSQLQHFRPDFFPVTSMSMHKKIRLLGTVLQSEDRESNIPARIGGRIEKVYIKSTGSMIKEGDPVVDLYGPRLITGGEEYLLARKSFNSTPTKEFKEMLGQSEERLKLWGIKKFQFESWYKKGKVPRAITIYSQSTGIVRKRNAIVGKYFKEGQNFFELSDLSDIWVEMDVYEHDVNLVKLGQKVNFEFQAIPGEKYEGIIDFINPVLNSKSRTLKIRTTISNPGGELRPGMVADSTLEIMFKGRPLVIPRTAIVDTGKRKVVWVKINQKQFQAKTIRTGHESEGYVEVKEGLMEGEEVVIEGNFLLDAQAQLFGGYQ